MMKSFPLQAPGQEDARVCDKVRHEVNKYVRRSQRKALPESFAIWEFIRKVGAARITPCGERLVSFIRLDPIAAQRPRGYSVPSCKLRP